MTRRLTADALLAHASPSVRAMNAHLAACAGDDADAVLAARAEREARRAQSRAAQASGASLEAWLDEQHNDARERGVADLEHLHPPVVVLRRIDERTFEGRWKSRSGPDYRGVLRGGQSVTIEAKSAGRGRLPLHDDGSPRFDGVKAHQAEALAREEALGGLALLVVRFTRRVAGRDVDTVYAVPWHRVAELATIGPDDVFGWDVRHACYLERFVGGAR